MLTGDELESDIDARLAVAEGLIASARMVGDERDQRLWRASRELWAADTIHPLDVRPGMWENTMTIQMSGTPPIPPEVLAKLTPEQKAMVEARMKTHEGQSAKPTVTKHCLTKEDLAKPLDFGGSRGTCKRTMLTSTSSKQELRIDCEMSGIKSGGIVRIETLDPEHVKVTTHMTSGDGSRAVAHQGRRRRIDEVRIL